jgi:hypothetical protein
MGGEVAGCSSFRLDRNYFIVACFASNASNPVLAAMVADELEARVLRVVEKQNEWSFESDREYPKGGIEHPRAYGQDGAGRGRFLVESGP